jgi:hypothetical protein
LSGAFGIHANQIVRWKKELPARGEEVFSHDAEQSSQDVKAREAEVYRQTGQ